MVKSGLVHVAATLLRPKMGYRHLFAYGPWLDEEVLGQLCPDPEFVTLARYDSRRWMVNSDGTATIVPRRDFRVLGVIWSVHEVGLAALDIHAGVPQQHDRFGSFAKTAAGQLCVSEFYATRNRLPGKGSPSYLRPILKAAQRWAFPQDYLDELSSWADLGVRADKPARGRR